MASIYKDVVSSRRGWSAPRRSCSPFVCAARDGSQPCASRAGTLGVCVLSQGGELSRAGLASVHQQLPHPAGGYQTPGHRSSRGQSERTGTRHVVPTPWHAGCQPPWGLHAREEHDYIHEWQEEIWGKTDTGRVPRTRNQMTIWPKWGETAPSSYKRLSEPGLPSKQNEPWVRYPCLSNWDLSSGLDPPVLTKTSSDASQRINPCRLKLSLVPVPRRKDSGPAISLAN